MVDEILRGFLDDLFARYREIVAREPRRRGRPSRRSSSPSFEAIDRAPRRGRDLPGRGPPPRRAAALRLHRRAARPSSAALWHDVLRPASPTAASAPTSTSNCPTASCATPSGSASAGTAPAASSTIDDDRAPVPVIVLDGIAARRRATAARKEISHGRGLPRRRGPHAGRPAQRRAVAGAPGRPRARTSSPRCSTATRAPTRTPSTTSSSAASTRSARRPATSPAPAGWPPASPTRCPA